MSLNEMQFYVTRAVVGAGSPFGVAEEAARAMVALAAKGQDPTAKLVRAMDALSTGEASSLATLDRNGGNRLGAVGGLPLSSLFAGPVVGDWMRAFRKGGDGRIELSGDALLIVAGAETLSVGPLDVPELARDIAMQVFAPVAPEPQMEGVMVDAESWAMVVQYFKRCLVPSSDESRLSGAGAGLNDTD